MSTAVMEGDVILAPSSSEMTAWKARIAALEVNDPARAEVEITDALTMSNEMLRAVSDVTAQAPADGAALASAGIGVAKLAAVRAAEFAKRLDLSKDTVLEAQMQQRRWERALGTAIREGQAAGEISTHGGDQRSSARASHSVRDYITPGEFNGTAKSAGVAALTDNATDAEFESALTTARDEGNVSRANVVRKLKGAPSPERAQEMSDHADSSGFHGALAWLERLADPRHVNNLIRIHALETEDDTLHNPLHNPEDIRRIAGLLNNYAATLENQS